LFNTLEYIKLQRVDVKTPTAPGSKIILSETFCYIPDATG